MNRFLKNFGGLSLVLGAFLNVVRMLPIYKDVGLDGYPPKTLAATVEIAQFTGYYVSHSLVFFATPFFLVGFYALCKRLDRNGENYGLKLALAVFSMGQVLYVFGVVIHGLVLPAMAEEFVAAAATEQAAMGPLIELNHKLATSYGGLGLAHLLVSTGILGLYLRAEFNWLGLIGMAIGLAALIGYTSGILDLMLFGSFIPTAGLATAMFAFYLVAGIRMLSPQTSAFGSGN